MTTGPDYRPPWWYRGRHLQTLWGPLMRRGRQPQLRRERVETPDGDFVDLEQIGWRGLVVNFRSCGGEVNRSRRMYHSGDTEDLEFIINRLTGREPNLRLGLIGVSLGGNVALKWLAEHGDEAPAQVAGAVAISTPFNLAACASALDRGL